MYDVIIIGGGPAGSTAGIYLSKKGYNVLIIDKEKFPRDKLCGGALTEKTISLLKDLGISNYRNVIDYETPEYGILWKNEEIYRGKSPYSFRFVKRSEYDSFLLNHAKKSGACVLEGHRVVNIDFKKREILLSDGKIFRYRFLIGADGVNSTVRKLLLREGLIKAERWRKNLANAVEIYISRKDVDFNKDYPLIILGYVKWGYGWVFPNRDRFVVGIGGLIDRNGNLKESLNLMLSAFFPGFRLRKIMGHTIPFGNFVEKPCYENVFLVGDAGGITNPASGEGIFSAQKSGLLAALSLESENPCDRYKELLDRYIYRDFKRDLKIRNIVYRLNSKLLTGYAFKLLNRKLEEVVHL